MRKKIGIVISIIALTGVSLSVANAQGLLRERIKERIKERRADSERKNDPTFFIMHQGITREYKVHLPSGYNKNTTFPLVIFLHGGGGSMQEVYKEGMDKMSDKHSFILAIPQGSGKKILGKTIGSWHSGNWSGWSTLNPGSSCCGYAGENNIDDVGFIAKMITEIKKNYAVDEKRIYATGISNGAMMSYRLACELSDTIAAAAPVAPPFVPEVCAQCPLPVSIIHTQGTADPCALYEGGTCDSCLGSKPIAAQSAKGMVNFWAKKNACSTEPTTIYKKGNAHCELYAQCQGGTEVEFCTIEGGGHTWPGGTQYLPASKIGPVSHDISFDQIWEFLQKHRLHS